MKRRAAGAALVALACAGCPKDEHAPPPGSIPDAAPLTHPSAATTATTATTATAAPPASALKPCRAIAIGGVVTPEDAGALHPGDQLPDALLTLGDGGLMTAKDPVSARETSLEGPGLARACVGGEAESWLLRGGFSSVPGAGESPGAEQWVVTPHGAIRYSVALLKVSVGKATSLRLIHGSAFVLGKVAFAPDAGAPPAFGAMHTDANGWTLVPEGATVIIEADGDAKARVDRCAAAAKEARDLGTGIVAPDANLSDLAPRHVEARRKARGVCAVARVAADALPTSAPERASLVSKAQAADADWRRVGP